MTTQAEPGAPAAAPVTDPAVAPAAPVAPATPASAATPSATPAPAATADVLPDGLGDWMKSKGWDLDNRESIIKGMNAYRETEKWALGGEKLVLPKEGAPQEAWDQLYTKLGRPESADKYQLEIPQGGDSAFALKAGEWFHKAGLNQNQAAGLAQAWNAHVAEYAAQQAEADAVAVREQSVKLDQEWGGDKSHNTELAKRGWNAMAQELGIQGEELDTMQDAIAEKLGVYRTMKLFKMMGEKIGTTGDKFEGGGHANKGGNLGMTPEGAKARIEALKGDRAFQERRARGDANAVKEWNELFVAAANGAVFTGN